MGRFILFTVNGLAFGAIYASVALSLVIIWRSTRVLNFAQGAQAVASAYAGWYVINATGSFWLGLLGALVAGALVGAAIQLTVFRTAENMPHINTIVIGVGLLLAIQAILGMAFPITTTRTIGAAFAQDKWRLGNVPLTSPQDIFVIGSVLAVMAVVGWLMTHTTLGLKMRATAFAHETARLMGVRVFRMLTLGWALAGIVSALAAMLVLPTSAELIPSAMDGVFVLGFVTAVVGGLESPVGAVVGGIATGLVLSYTSGYASPDLLYPAALALLVIVLLVKPEGLISAAQARRV